MHLLQWFLCNVSRSNLSKRKVVIIVLINVVFAIVVQIASFRLLAQILQDQFFQLTIYSRLSGHQFLYFIHIHWIWNWCSWLRMHELISSKTEILLTYEIKFSASLIILRWECALSCLALVIYHKHHDIILIFQKNKPRDTCTNWNKTVFGTILECCNCCICRYILDFVSNGTSIGSTATLNVIETNEFKHLTHLSLKFVSCTDTEVKKYLADCLKALKVQMCSYGC